MSEELFEALDRRDVHLFGRGCDRASFVLSETSVDLLLDHVFGCEQEKRTTESHGFRNQRASCRTDDPTTLAKRCGKASDMGSFGDQALG